MNPEFEIKYKSIPPENLPLTECLKDTVARFLPLWTDTIAPQIKKGKSVLIAAHGNSLRALLLVMKVYKIEEINSVELSTGVPIHIIYQDSQFLIKK